MEEIDVSHRWVHRIIFKERPPSGVEWDEEFLKKRMGKIHPLNVFGGTHPHFLAEYQIVEDGRAALLTFDYYDLEGL